MSPIYFSSTLMSSRLTKRCRAPKPWRSARATSASADAGGGGGAIFVRDPYRKIVSEQLNGGGFADLTPRDWRLILPYLQANEELWRIAKQIQANEELLEMLEALGYI